LIIVEEAKPNKLDYMRHLDTKSCQKRKLRLTKKPKIN